MANNYRATLAPYDDADDYTVDPTTDIDNTDLDFGGGGVIGMLALGCFSAGFVSLLLCSFGADHAQTSLKTITLMSLATLLSLPIPIFTDSTAGVPFVEYILYSLNVIMVLYAAYVRFTPTFKTTYDPKLDSFPHFLLCFLPAVGITIGIFYFLEYVPNSDGERTLAACHEELGFLYCGLLIFRLSSAMLYMLAFIPQVYVVFKIWAGHSQSSAGFEKVVYFKIKLFLALMFASFLLRSLWWLLWANANQLWTDEVFFIFFSANAVAALVLILPWLVRGTCMQLCQCTSCSCCIRPPQRDDPGANAHIRVNTGQSNDNAIEQAEEEKKRKSWFTTPVSTISISSSFSPKNKTPTTVLDEHDAPPEEERNVGVILPEGLGSSNSSNGGGSPPSWQRPMSSFAGSTSSTTNGYNTDNANVLSPASVPGTSPSVATYYSPTAAPAGAAAGAHDRPDWLRED